MQPEGLESFKKRNEKKSKIYTYENEEVKFSPDFEKDLRQIKTPGIIFNL